MKGDDGLGQRAPAAIGEALVEVGLEGLCVDADVTAVGAGRAHFFAARRVLDLGVSLGDGVEEVLVVDGLFVEGVETKEALLVEGGAQEFLVEYGGRHRVFEVVGEILGKWIWQVWG